MTDLSQIQLLKHGVGKTKFSGTELMDIYYRVLTNSTSWDQALGYFRLSSMNLLAYPLAKFILHNKGKVRIYCNEQFSEADYKILTTANSSKFEDTNLFKDIISLTKALEESNDKLFSECIHFLIQEKRLEIKVLVKKNQSIGIAHEKNGIFKDSNGNIVVFTGSANASEQAFKFNKEDTTAFCSFWNEWSSTSTIETTIHNFEKIFNYGDEEWTILNIESEDLKRRLEKYGFPKVEESELKNTAFEYIKNNSKLYSVEIQNEIELEIKKLESSPEYKLSEILREYKSKEKYNFPFEKLRTYQIDAIEKWKENGYNGILAMATGTGKTFTAFGAISEFLKIQPKVIVCICCPYQHLVEQWAEQLESFGVKPILVYDNKNKWIDQLNRRLRQFEDSNYPAFIIATNASLLEHSVFYSTMKKHWSKTFLIVDEAHNVGSGKLKNSLPVELKAKLALSATIDRYFDEGGTEFLKNYFGGIVYELSLKDAIGKFLVNYEYYPIPVELTDEEFDEYYKLSEQIEFTRFKDDEESEEKLKNLYMKRARIVNNSDSKIVWLRDNIKEQDELSHTLFYVGDEKFDKTIELLSKEKNIVADGFSAETKNRKEVLNNFNNQITKCLVAMKCLDEGVDVPATKKAYFLANSGNPKEFIQRRGRVLRRSQGKSIAILIDLISIPPDWIIKDSKEFRISRNSLKKEFKRIREFSSLSLNKYTSLDLIKKTIEKFDLYSEI